VKTALVWARRSTARNAALAAACFVFTAGRARATYSIVGADSATRETGGAGTSCLFGSDVFVIYGAVPGVGTVHAQARYSPSGLREGVRLLEQGRAPADILATLTSSAFDPLASVRQYAVVDVTGRVAAFTGADDGVYAGDRQGQAGTFVYSAQGNILTGRAVVDQAANAFEASGCDLPERLMRALEAGAANGQGDSRCTDSRGIPSDSAFLQVERPNEPLGGYLALRVPTSGDADPLLELRSAFDSWRRSHPCPAGTDAGTGAAGGANGPGPPADLPANPDRPEGCGCHLPRGRTLRESAFALLAAGLWLRRRAKSPARVRGAHPRIS
jgi:uncharacterized Ntn-hydrolase superfamily protein